MRLDDFNASSIKTANKGMQRENKPDDPIFLLHFLNVLCMNINCAKFDKNLVGTSFSRELP